MCIETITKNVNLEVIEDKTMSFNDVCFRYIRANKNVTSIKYPTISQYFLVELTEDNVKIFKRKEGYVSFKQFQHKLLSTTYFQAKNDLRWNIYLIFIEDDYSELTKDCPTLDIENDENFARKYFFKKTEAIQFLSEEYIGQQSKNSVPINPLSEWIDILDKVQLTGTIYNEFSSSVVEQYIYNDKPYNDSNRLSKLSEISGADIKKFQIQHIKGVEVGKFRPHCFSTEEKFRPVLVNLLHGANGSGKTSILESIEYALTDNIRRQEDYKDESNLPEICLIANSGQNQRRFKSHQASRVYKEIDRAWYGSPLGRGNCTLNMNFNHFNCFNAESAYKFALEESKNENKYIDIFTNLIFDSSLLAYQRNWLRYEKEFTDKTIEINKSLNSANQNLNRINDELKNLTTTNIDTHDLDDLLVNLKYIDNNKGLDLSDKYQRINTVLAAVKPISDNLKNNLICLQLNNLEGIHEKKEQNSLNIEDLSASIKDKIEKQKEENNKIQLAKNSITDLSKETIENDNAIALLQLTLEDWGKYRLIISNPQRVNELNKLKLRKQELSDQIKFLQKLNLEYPDIKQWSDVDIALTDISKQIEDLDSRITGKQEQLIELIKKLEENKKKMNRQRQIKVQLKAITTDLLESSRPDKCPLCGVKHENYEALLRNIEKELNYSKDEEIISTIEINKNKLQNELEQLQEALFIYKTKQDNTSRIFKLARELCSRYKIEINADPFSVLKNIHSILMSCENLVNEQNQVERLIDTYIQEGFNDEIIQSSVVFTKTNPHYTQYIQSNREDSFETFIATTKQEIDKQTIYNQSQIALAQVSIEASKTLIESLNPSELQNKLEILKSNQKIIDNILNDYSKCLIYFNINSSDAIISFAHGIETALLKSGILVTQLQNLQSVKLKRTEMQKLEQDMDKLKKYLTRCKGACSAFQLMPKLNERVTDFVEVNKERIQLFFKALHTPKEFVSLDIVDNKLVVIREKDKRQIHMYQMSTGQRASLALAVIFTLYLSAENAPRFLLLDEPVANMDDLHLMNLMDILRVLALNGTQIIFTTANPIVAGIFRRKFSFFGDSFNHFELSRYNLEPIKIKIIKYSPDKEEGEILQPVS